MKRAWELGAAVGHFDLVQPSQHDQEYTRSLLPQTFANYPRIPFSASLQSMSTTRPPVPPRPYEFGSPDNTSNGPPPIPPLPPNFRPESDYDVQPHFADPLVAPRPQKLQPDLPANVSVFVLCWAWASELMCLGFALRFVLRTILVGSSGDDAWVYRWTTFLLCHGWTRVVLDLSRWRARSMNRWRMVDCRRLSHTLGIRLLSSSSNSNHHR